MYTHIVTDGQNKVRWISNSNYEAIATILKNVIQVIWPLMQ